MEAAEGKLNTGAASFGKIRSLILAAVITGGGGLVTSVAGFAYTVGVRNTQMAATERIVGELVDARKEQERERTELLRRRDAFAATIEGEKTARAGLEELVRAALMARRAR